MRHTSLQTYSISRIKRYIFLREIWLMAIGGMGGAGAHLNIMIRRLVKKRAFLSEAELMELHSFCSMLPGPTSTQMITAMGYKFGGPWLSFFCLVVWVLPASILMTMAVIAWHFTDKKSISLEFLHYMQPMAVGFIAAAAFKLFGMIKHDKLSVNLYIVGAIGASVFRSPWIFPVLLIFGGWLSQKLNQNKFPPHKPKLKPRWHLPILFFLIFGSSIFIGNLSGNVAVLLFENSFQYGSIVFGGGNVLIPMMFKQYVTFKQYLNANEFLLGVGLLQTMPGPVFSISTYANAMALQQHGVSGILLGSMIGTVGINLPGIMMVFFFYPIWSEIKKMPLVRKAIEGIKAVSAGIVLAAAFLLSLEMPSEALSLPVLLATILLVIFSKVPPYLIVFATITLGILAGY